MITQEEVKIFTSHALKEEERYKQMGRVIEEYENEGEISTTESEPSASSIASRS